MSNWFHVKSEWQKNSRISTLWLLQLTWCLRPILESNGFAFWIFWILLSILDFLACFTNCTILSFLNLCKLVQKCLFSIWKVAILREILTKFREIVEKRDFFKFLSKIFQLCLHRSSSDSSHKLTKSQKLSWNYSTFWAKIR